MAVKKIEVSFTTSSGGAFTQVLALNGAIMRVVTNPGSTAPTDDWDLTLVDADGLDLLMGRGANRDTANSEQFCPGLSITDGTTTSVIPVVHNGSATLTIANAGDTKNGTITIYSRE